MATLPRVNSNLSVLGSCSEVSSRSMATSELPSLTVKGTFIQTVGADQTRSPRAHSDPGSVLSERERDTSVDFELASAASLNQKMRSVWCLPRGSEAQSQEDLGDVSSRLSSNSETFCEVASPRRVDVSSRPSSSKRPKEVRCGGVKVPCRKEKPFSAALTVVEEIPDMVHDVLERNSDRMKTEVLRDMVALRHLIVSLGLSEGEADIAMEKLRAIPEMVHETFAHRFEILHDSMRLRVEELIEEVGAEVTKDELIELLWRLPPKVQELSACALQESLTDFQTQAWGVLDRVWATGCWGPEFESDLHGLKLNVLQVSEVLIKEKASDFEEDAMKAAASLVEAAAVVIRAQQNRKPAWTTNSSFAESLLSAKIACLAEDFAPFQPKAIDEDKSLVSLTFEKLPEASIDEAIDEDKSLVSLTFEAAEKMAVVSVFSALSERTVETTSVDEGSLNPGSRGHPELCRRPCLYFARGRCSTGASCEFCHESHERSVPHLDKQQRQLLRKFSFAERLVVAMPILKTKVEALQPTLDALLQIRHLEALASKDVSASGKACGALARCLKALPLRGLLSALHRALPQDAPEHEALRAVRVALFPDSSKEGSQADNNTEKASVSWADEESC